MLCQVPKISIEEAEKQAIQEIQKEQDAKAGQSSAAPTTAEDDINFLNNDDFDGLHEGDTPQQVDLEASMQYVETQISGESDEIVLANKGINDMFIGQLIDLIAEKGAHNISVFDLSSNEITDEGCSQLCEAFCLGKEGTLENVSVINFRNNQITEESVEYLHIVTEQCPNIKSIKLSGNPVYGSSKLSSNDPRGVFQN